MCMCVCRQLYVGKLSNDFRGPQTGNFQMTLEGHYITPKSVPQTHIGRMVRLAESRGRGGYISIQPMILSHVLRFANYFPYLLYLFVLKGVTLEHKVLYTVCHLFTKYNLPNFLVTFVNLLSYVVAIFKGSIHILAHKGSEASEK